MTFGTYRGPDGRADRAPSQTATAPASRGQRRARRQRAGHRQPRDEPGRHTAAARPELLGRPPVLAPTTARRSRPRSRPPTGQAPAVDELRLHAAPDPRRLRGDRLRDDRQGPDGRDRGRLRLADHAEPTRTSTPRSPATSRSRPASTQQYLARPFTATAPNECDAAGLVRRGDARRRVGARHGAGRQRRLRRRGQLPDPDLVDALALIVNNAPGQHRQQLLGRARQYSAIERSASRRDLPGGRGRGHRLLLLLRGQRLREPGRGPGLGHADQVDYPTSRARTSPRWAAPAWPSASTTTTSSRPPGAPCSTRWPANGTSPGSTRRPACTPAATTARAAAA